MQLDHLKYDLSRYFYPSDGTIDCSLLKKFRIIIKTQGIWAIVIYRFRRWLHTECRIDLLRMLLKPIGTISNLVVECLTGIHIRPEIDIGPGLYIGHFGNIFLGGCTQIGKFANISQEVTVGFAGRGSNWGLPKIGDFVYIAPGAKIIGCITIGNNVAIGANAVVIKDLPDDAVAVGVPARIISYDSSRDFVLFNRNKCRKILE
jgi:serine O-acetyltransferase